MTNIALFGAGGVGAYHLASIRRQEMLGRARLVAVADPTADRFPEVRAELEGRGVRWHQDYRDLLREESRVDAVVIATPIPFHYDMAMACLERDLFVSLEKPPAPLLPQLESLIAADPRHRLSVGFQMIGSRAVQALKAILVEGTLGEIREIRAAGCWPRLDGYYQRAGWAGKLTLGGQPVLDGPATNALAHVIHNIMFLAAKGHDDFAVPVEVAGELYRARRIESYDVAALRGRFASGITFGVAVTHATERALPYRIEVQGTTGRACLSNDGATLEVDGHVTLEAPETTQQLLDADHDRFLDVIEGCHARFRTSLSDTRGYVSATNAMFLSSKGIHDIDAACRRPYQVGTDRGFDVQDLWTGVNETLATGKLFSEQRLPWAAAVAAPVNLEGADFIRRTAEILSLPSPSA